MGNVPAALKRKFGPLPAWAWLGIVAGAVYFYRRSQAGKGLLGAANVPAAQTPGISDQGSAATPSPPTVLQPGEAAYNQDTGQLVKNELPPDVATPPDSGGGTAAPADPGAGVAPALAQKAQKKRVLPRAGQILKRVPKPKVGAGAHRGVAGPQRAKATRPRGAATHRPAAGARSRTAPHPTAAHTASKARPAAIAVAKSPGRSRAPMPPSAALRQRPAAPLIVHPAVQKVVPHPAAVPAAVHKAAPKPAPKKKR